ncbi:MAG: alpha/beta fold hydrolase, partial [Actinomycetota bacterium]|nr:alpha/beta fold hydrolase [Actinomycetota bacterium]
LGLFEGRNTGKMLLDLTGRFLDLLAEAAAIRPAFAEAAELTDPPAPVRLAEGRGAEPPVFCIPSVVALSGPHEYTTLAAKLGGDRTVWALPWPGFEGWEPLPASFRAAVDVQADAIVRASAGEPSIVLGHSTGGLFAHAIAARLEERGSAPAGVVLIDTPAAEAVADPDVGQRVMDALLERGASGVDDARLTAMAAYVRLLADCEPAAVAAPTLLLRAETAFPWTVAAPGEHVAVTVPGDHFSMMDGDGESTARALLEWLATATSGRLSPA